MRSRAFNTVSAVIGFVGISVSTASGQVQWRTGTSAAPSVSAAEAMSALTAAPDGQTRHVVVQFAGAVTPQQRDALNKAGVKLQAYLSDHAYFAAVKSDVDAQAVGRAAQLADVQPIQRQWKLQPALARREKPTWAAVPVPQDAPAGADKSVMWFGAYVLFHADISDAAARDIVARHGIVMRYQFTSVHGMVIEMPLSKVGPLADEDAVQYLEAALPKMGVNNDGNRARTGADIVQAAPYGLDGTGVSVMVYDAGTGLDVHPDFGGRLHVRDTSGTVDHSTHCAGTIGGAGTASNGLLRGMAPGVTIEAYGFETGGTLAAGFLYTDPGDMEHDYNEAINVYGADIASNSIGTNTAPNGFPCEWEGDYGVTDTVIDSIVRGGLGAPFRVVWANGNERGSGACGVTYHTTAPPACAKNHITIGALNSNDDSVTSFTSWGPTDDGRLKPDVSGPGCQSDGDLGVTSTSSMTVYTSMCGTSMATPTVCGCAALMLQDYRAHFPGQPDFRNSTLKILLAHTAVDLGNPGPDYQTGYGSIRVQAAIDFMRLGQFQEGQVTHGGVIGKSLIVTNSTQPLKITLAWDDVPGTPNVSPALVNDLDLRVFDPSNVRRYPWTLNPANPGAAAVRTQADHANNIEQVYVASPAVGAWRVEVHGYNVPQGPQSFSIASSHPLVNCSSAGTVGLDQSTYSCSSIATIQVVDCDLNANPAAVETVTVTAMSNTEPAGETVLLTETGVDSAEFRGTISLSSTNAAGVVQVANGDTLTIRYTDANNGAGGTNVPVTSTATIDCQGPVITNVQVSDVSVDSAVVTFTTSEAATGAVRFGTACGSLAQTATESSSPSTAHQVTMSGLSSSTRYAFAVDARDAYGNLATLDNAGACFDFKTLDVVATFPLDSDPGWTREGQWAFGQPTGGGSHNHDPASGFTGTNVFGYNLGGDYPDNLAVTYLTTGAMNCSGVVGVSLRFRRWLGVESNSNFDQATVEASNNGTSWTVIWRATDGGVDISDAGWQLQQFDLSGIADNRPALYLRWGMGPTDTSNTFPGWNLDDVQVVGHRLPLVITFPDGLPASLTPNVPTSIRVSIQAGTENYVAASAALHYRYQAGAFTTASLVPLGGSLYQATLPPTGCTSRPEFYFTAQGSGGSSVASPSNAPLDVYTAVMGTIVTFSDDFESVQLWTVDVLNDTAQTGLWTRVDPIGSPAQPEDDHTPGAGSFCFVTGQEPPGGSTVPTNNDVDAGKTTLISPTFDLSGAVGGVISYWRWYSNSTGSAPNSDVFAIDISNDNGMTWVNAETVGPAGPETSGGWFFHSFEITNFVSPTALMKVRFVASDYGEGSVVEAAVDDFLVTANRCDLCPNDPNKIDPGACGCGVPDTDSDGDGVPDCNDLCSATPGCARSVDASGCPALDCHGDAAGCNPNARDVPRFVEVLLGVQAYDCIYDHDGSGAVDGSDVQPFVNVLLRT